jgi:SMI1 / KNR4 family.
MDNPCRNCEKNIVLSDIKSVEKVLSYCFPEEFILHYLSFNGGVPSRAWWESNDGFEPLEIAFLKPIKYNKLTNDDPKSLIDGCYHEMITKNVIPINIIPFGNDWCGNYFCLNKNDGSVIFYATDSFDPNLSMDKNHALVQKKLASSFKEFMDKLVTEENLD